MWFTTHMTTNSLPPAAPNTLPNHHFTVVKTDNKTNETTVLATDLTETQVQTHLRKLHTRCGNHWKYGDAEARLNFTTTYGPWVGGTAHTGGQRRYLVKVLPQG